MPDGGSVVIAAENANVDEGYAAISPEVKVGRHVLLCITDTAVECLDRQLKKSSTLFHHQTTRQRHRAGTFDHLGIVKSHAGFLSVSSDPGRGTTFKIFLPAEDAESTPAKTVAREQIQGTMNWFCSWMTRKVFVAPPD